MHTPKPDRVRLTNDRAAAVDHDYHWRHMDACPLGAKVQLLTEGGVAIYGLVSNKTRSEYLGWAPLPKKPDWMKR